VHHYHQQQNSRGGCAHVAAQRLSHSRARVSSHPHTFTGLVCSKFVITIKLEKWTKILCCFWKVMNLMSVMDVFRKSLPPPELHKATQLMLRRHKGLRTSNPGLEETLPVATTDWSYRTKLLLRTRDAHFTCSASICVSRIILCIIIIVLILLYNYIYMYIYIYIYIYDIFARL
jgi:hypothetical protein